MQTVEDGGRRWKTIRFESGKCFTREIVLYKKTVSPSIKFDRRGHVIDEVDKTTEAFALGAVYCVVWCCDCSFIGCDSLIHPTAKFTSQPFSPESQLHLTAKFTIFTWVT